MTNSENIYKAPDTDVENPSQPDEVTERETLIKHEAAVRSIGVLYYLGGGLAVTLGVGMGLSSINADPMTIPFIILAVLGVAMIVVGYGVRRLRRWSVRPIGFLSGVGLLGFPVGTLINAYILYLIFSKKGRRVFSEEYAGIIERTPQVRRGTSPVVAFVLLLLVVAIVAAILIPGFS